MTTIDRAARHHAHPPIRPPPSGQAGMKIDVAVAELKGVRVAIAFAPAALVGPGAGDDLLARLRPWFPTLPVLLVALDEAPLRAYAPFQADALVAGCDLGGLGRRTVDLDAPPPRPDAPAPF